MIVILLLLLAVTGLNANYGPVIHKWDDLRTRFGIFGPLDGSFARWPRLASAALDLGFVAPPEEPNVDFDVLCPENDPAVCLIFDKRGNIGGMEFTVLRTDLPNKAYPMEKSPMIRPITRFGKLVYTTTLFTVPQKFLSRDSGRDGLTPDGTGTGLWLQTGPTREHLFEIPRFEKDIGQTLYTKQMCIPGMGRHYFYNVTSTMSCKDGFPIFALYRTGELIGFGWQAYGKFTQFGKTRFEMVPRIAIRPTIPKAPQCMYDYMDKFGAMGLHVYFVDNPWYIHCIGS